MTNDLQPDPPATQDDLPERGRILAAIGLIALAGLIAVVIIGSVVGLVLSSGETTVNL